MLRLFMGAVFDPSRNTASYALIQALRKLLARQSLAKP
jgi:hypothetical protein